MYEIENSEPRPKKLKFGNTEFDYEFSKPGLPPLWNLMEKIRNGRIEAEHQASDAEGE